MKNTTLQTHDNKRKIIVHASTSATTTDQTTSTITTHTPSPTPTPNPAPATPASPSFPNDNGKKKKKKKKKRKLGITDYIAIAVIIFIIGSWAYSGLWKPYKVVISKSMEPTINKGDIVYVVKIRDHEKIHVGEIVLYTRPDFPEPILHRVIKIETITYNGHPMTCYVIKGDNNPAPDPPYPIAPGKQISCVPSYAIIGKEVFRIPDVGKIFLWIHR